MTPSPFYKKTLTYKHTERLLQFQVSQSLFSSASIDHGTARLLRTLIFQKVNSYQKALDLGCGYGPIGITLKASQPQAEVHMVDRDALALEFSHANAQLNQVGEVKTYPSLGYDQIADTDFDLITSNIPAKAGQPVIRHLLKDAQHFLTPNGLVAIVITDSIADFVNDQLTTDDNIQIQYHRHWPGHHVYHYQFTNPSDQHKLTSAFNDGLYFRDQNPIRFQGRNYQLDTANNLPEFNQISFQTELLINNLSRIKSKPQHILCLNPGQGYIPLLIAKKFNPKSIHLVDRDLLSLKTTQHNLQKHNLTSQSHHQSELSINHSSIDLIIGQISEKQDPAVYQLYTDQIQNQLQSGGHALLASTSTVITRLEDLIQKSNHLKTQDRQKQKSQSTLLVKKT